MALSVIKPDSRKVYPAKEPGVQPGGTSTGYINLETALVAQRLGQLVERTVQILIELLLLINLLDGVEDRRVVLASELASDFRQ